MNPNELSNTGLRAPHPDGLWVHRVTVRYGTERHGTDARANQPLAAVRDATFGVARGEVVALTGPSGCGKTTLLRAIAGIEPLSGGSVHWGGENLAGVPPHLRGFGLVFQDGQLFAHMNVEKNIAYGLAAQRVPKAEREARVLELLELIGMPEYGKRSVTELSGGQRQRVALARSLAPKPRLLLLDEPLSSLDHGLRQRLAADLARLLRESETTAILVTHDPQEADAIADRVLPMSEGTVGASL